jgi:predicted acetyltransferase
MLREKSFNSERQLYEYEILNSEGESVGMAQLRLIPSKSPEMPEGFESHIYYEVSPAHRDKGYATQALKALIQEAKDHGLNQLVATVNSNNIPSIKVIEKCGGKLLGNAETKRGQSVLKYQLATV